MQEFDCRNFWPLNGFWEAPLSPLSHVLRNSYPSVLRKKHSVFPVKRQQRDVSLALTMGRSLGSAWTLSARSNMWRPVSAKPQLSSVVIGDDQLPLYWEWSSSTNSHCNPCFFSGDSILFSIIHYGTGWPGSQFSLGPKFRDGWCLSHYSIGRGP